MTKINKKIISFLFLAMAVVSVFVSSSITTNASDKYIDEDKNKNETIEKKVKKFKSKVPTEIENKTEFESSEKYNVYMQELEKIGKENKKDKEILNKIEELDKKFSQIKTRSIYSFYYMTKGEKWYYATHPWDIQFASNVVNSVMAGVAESKYGYSHDSGVNDHKDAFRHARWTEWLVCAWGADHANYVTWLHEEESYNQPRSRDMDLHNNREGAKLACKGPWEIKNAMKKGYMRVFPTYDNGWYLWSTWY